MRSLYSKLPAFAFTWLWMRLRNPSFVARVTASLLGVAAEAQDEHGHIGQPATASAVDGLIAYWPFDEGAGGVAANVMQQDPDIYGSTSPARRAGQTWTSGVFGSAVAFNGRDGPLIVDPTTALDCNTAVTVSLWVKLDDRPQSGPFLDFDYSFQLGVDRAEGNRIRFRQNFELDIEDKWLGDSLVSATPLRAQKWHHVAGVFDGHERRIYVDGQLDVRGPARGMLARASFIAIGGVGFSGAIDEVKVWNRALSDSEIGSAMHANQSQIKRMLSAEDALNFYPIRSAVMAGKGEVFKIRAVNTSAKSAYDGEVALAVIDTGGSAVHEVRQRLSLSPGGIREIEFEAPPNRSGSFNLVLRHGSRELLRTPLYVLAPRGAQPTGPMKMSKVVTVDLAQELGVDQLCDDGTSRIVNSPLGRYREGGGGRFSRFAVRATVKRPGLHLMRVTYPDDKSRTCEVLACSPVARDLYSVQSGYFTGVEHGLSNGLKTLDCIIWARDVNQTIVFTTWAEGRPAAASRVELFEIEGGLKLSAGGAAPSLRQIGLYWEDAQPLAWCFGAGDVPTYEDFDRVVGNLCDYMGYSGQNTLIHPVVWYEGPIYNSLVERRGYGLGVAGGRAFPAGWLDILLRRFEERGFTFYGSFNVHHLPSLRETMNASREDINQGKPTFNAITNHGEVTERTTHHKAPAFNALHPQVQGRVLALVDELASRYGKSPAFGGLSFHLTRCQLLQLGGVDTSYDDWTVKQFENDTGIAVPIASLAPDRFQKRYDWLMANCRERWIRWRCERIADYYGMVARRLRNERPDLQLVLAVLYPMAVHTELRTRWEKGERLVDISREAGIDPMLISRHDGTVIQKQFGPSDLRWSLTRPGSEAEKALLPMRQMQYCDDQLRDYRSGGAFGVFFYNRYFETDIGARKPLRTYWYKDPQWRASAIMPSGEHFLEYYAHTLALYDPTLMVSGGFTTGTVGHENDVERFAGVFRRLPPGRWEVIPQLGDNLVGRTLNLSGRRYLYLVNRGSSAVRIVLPESMKLSNMVPLGASPAIDHTAGTHVVTLSAYQLAAWETSN